MLFFLLNINIKHKNYYEKFEENKYCGKQNDICTVHSSGKTSCCDDHKCILPKGDYQYKICVNKNNIFTDVEKIAGLSVPNLNVSLPEVSLPDMSLPDIYIPDVSLQDVYLPDISLPNIPKPNIHKPNMSLPNMSFFGLTLPKFSLPKINLTPNMCPSK